MYENTINSEYYYNTCNNDHLRLTSFEYRIKMILYEKRMNEIFGPWLIPTSLRAQARAIACVV